MGVGTWLQEFCGNLRIGPQKRPDIGYRTGRVVSWLYAGVRKLDSSTSYRFYVGSCGRSTVIPSVNAVDLLYERLPDLYTRFNSY